MKRLWTLAFGLALLVLAGWLVWQASSRPVWTTDDPVALSEFEQGLESQMKFYQAEAREHFQRAVELDPGFVAAKVRLADLAPKAERDALIEQLRRADRAGLSDRERFLLDYSLANADGDAERAEGIVRAFLADHPDDPWALMTHANREWERRDWEEAESAYHKLLEVDPNWVTAHNILGYIAMARGRFDESEARFRTYRYAAPDQANPHDSLGELLVLIGRYDEARAELEEAVRIRPDFCASYGNLFTLAVLERRPEELDPVVDRVEANCDERMTEGMRCEVDFAKAFLAPADPVDWAALEASCGERIYQVDVVNHLVALRAGHRDVALEIEARAKARSDRVGGHGYEGKNMTSLVGLLEGQRLLYEGDPAAAVEKLRAIDSEATWWGSGGAGLGKLVGRLLLAEALEQSGQSKEAAEVRSRVEEVNPAFARAFAGYAIAAAGA